MIEKTKQIMPKPNPTSIRTIIMNMEIGCNVEFDIVKLKSVRTEASELGLQLSRKYTTKTDRDARTITVFRIS